MRYLFILLLSLVCVAASGQGTFRHLQYNLTLYGNPFGCNETTNNSEDKEAYLRDILAFAQPDIFCVNEMRDQNFWANRILNDVLNTEDELWARADLSSQFTSSSIVNAFYFREDKFSLYEQEVVFQNMGGSLLLRPIDLYTLYLEAPSLAQGDTTFFTCIVAHLSASDEDERYDQTEALMARLVEKGPGYYIFSGDLNIDSALEGAFQNLVAHPDEDLAFVDPLSLPSQWNNNPSVAQYHTQSTRFGDTNSGCFSGGGLDDRFDLTLLSPSMLEANANVSYVPGSYVVLGQSGNDYNQELETFQNGAVPDDIAMALYEASDHLPVMTDYSSQLISGLNESELLSFEVRVDGNGQIFLAMEKEGYYQLEMLDLAGRILNQRSFKGRSHILPSVTEPAGVYLISILHNGERAVRKVFLGP